MRIEIEIPKEIECDFAEDRFEDFFERVIADMQDGCLCGEYEKETARGLLKAFQGAKRIEERDEKRKKRDKGNGGSLLAAPIL